MRIKKYLFKSINWLLMRKQNSVSRMVDESIELFTTRDLHISSNVTIGIEENDRKGFFRECRLHLELEKYVEQLIIEYFKIIYTEEDSKVLFNLIISDLQDKNNYKAFLKLPVIYEEHQIEMRNMSFSRYDLIGLSSLAEVHWRGRISFLKYCKGGLEDYYNNVYLNHNSLHNFNLNRQLATRKMAEILGLSEIIPQIKVVNLLIGQDKYKMTGTLMSTAGNANPCMLSQEKRNLYTKKFVQQISNLEYLDAICYQLDHRLGNYNVVIDDDYIVGVTAFDNDAPMTFFPALSVPKNTYCGCSSLLNGKKMINRPYIDCAFYNTINSVSFIDVYKGVGPYLTFAQIIALYQRVKIVRRAINKSVRDKCLMVINDVEWEYIQEDKYLNGSYGMTYLKYYLEVDERARVIELMGVDKTDL